MSERDFRELLEARWAEGKFVCVGLDPDIEKIPRHILEDDLFDPQWSFNQQIVDATCDLVCAYKPNAAFYEEFGADGWKALHDTIIYINQKAPGVPVILDAKRADIGNTNNGYVKGAFHELNADAITVHPYLGQEALQPFLERTDKGIFVLCRTSNPGAGEFQNLVVRIRGEEETILRDTGTRITDGRGACFTELYNHVAYRVATEWDKRNNCGLVAGATYPDEIQQVRKIAPNLPLLIPGIGAQGGDLEKTVKAALDSRRQGFIINSSRGIIFASNGEDFAEAARHETEKLHNAINQFRSAE